MCRPQLLTKVARAEAVAQQELLGNQECLFPTLRDLFWLNAAVATSMRKQWLCFCIRDGQGLKHRPTLMLTSVSADPVFAVSVSLSTQGEDVAIPVSKQVPESDNPGRR
ncbi:unnamed protein product [Symbiodinium natans]|uniref:Uncharacterized protein n=1 Tax=Symbiodinium natans TaxID=878477 RepID=A0A812J484_9DINO|nr:unnamed protein product [Symbiodinium natans]